MLENFNQFFQVRKYVIIERAQFNSLHQQEGETFKQYISALYRLAETCNYAGLKEEMIRDCLVVGIRDKSLSERLQMDAALTLEKAKTTIRQCEAIQDNRPLWKEDSSPDPITVDALNGKAKQFDKNSRKSTTTPKNVLNVEGEFTEETNVQHVMPYAISVVKRVITVPTAHQDQ